jgi:hypothetical protein
MSKKSSCNDCKKNKNIETRISTDRAHLYILDYEESLVCQHKTPRVPLDCFIVRVKLGRYKLCSCLSIAR